MTARFILLLAALATGCAAAASPARKAPAPSAERGLALAQQHCAGCHGVTANALSTNPESPSFEDIANRNGLSETTLDQFLVDSHNFPAAMDFKVTRPVARDLATWILTMRKPGYERQP